MALDADVVAATISILGAVTTLIGLIYDYRIKRQNAQIEGDRNAIAGFDNLCDQLNAEIARLEARVQENDAKIGEMEKELVLMRAENADLRRQIRLYEAENAGLRAEIRDLRAQLAKYQGERAE